MKTCAYCMQLLEDNAIECPKCHKSKFGRADTTTSPGDTIRDQAEPSGNFSDLRLVMALSHAVQHRFKDYPPEMAAAVFLAITDKKRDDLVERPEGIYLSRQCWDRISSYFVWLAEDGTIIVTRKRLQSQPDEPKEDSQEFLEKHLPMARKLCRINSFHYALGLALEFGLDQNRLVVQKDQIGVAILDQQTRRERHAMGIFDRLFKRSKPAEKDPLSQFARELLSESVEVSDAAIIRVLDLARGGKHEGLKALEEAIRYMHGKENIDFYTPGLRQLNGFSMLDEAKEKLLSLARQRALWKTPPKQVQELLSLAQVGGTDVRTLWLTVNELGCGQDQVRAIQLLGLHLAVQVILNRGGKP